MENYKILGTVGKGGMGRVYKATRILVNTSNSNSNNNTNSSSTSSSPSSSPPASLDILASSPNHHQQQQDCYNGNHNNSLNNTIYALKKVEVSSLKQLNQSLKEAQAVLQLNHKRIVKCFEFFVDRVAVADYFDYAVVSNPVTGSKSIPPPSVPARNHHHHHQFSPPNNNQVAASTIIATNAATAAQSNNGSSNKRTSLKKLKKFGSSSSSSNSSNNNSTTSGTSNDKQQQQQPATARRYNSDDDLYAARFAPIHNNNNNNNNNNNRKNMNLLPRSESWFVCMVFEFCSQGSLKDRIERQKVRKHKQYITEELLWMWLQQLCEGIAYMHNQNVIHRDLKPENILLDDQDNVKIGDMGLARILHEDSTHASTVGGTIYFLAPEMKTSSPKYDSKLDIWGLGCIACELASLVRCDYSYVLSNPVEQKKIYDSILEHFSERVIDFISLTLQNDPNDRPTAQSLLVDFFGVNPQRKMSNLSLTMTPRSMSGSIDFTSATSRHQRSSSYAPSTPTTLVSRRIPDEIYILIFSYFTEYEIATCSQVCSRWLDLFQSNKGGLWKSLFASVWKTDLTPSLESDIEQDFGSLRGGFIYRAKLERNWHVGKYKYASFLLHGGSAVSSIHFFTGNRITNHYLKHIYRHHKQRRKNMVNKGSRSMKSKSSSSSSSSSFVDDFKFDEEYGMHSLTITGSEDGTLKAFDVYGFGLGAQNKPLRKELLSTFAGHQKGVSCVDFNLDFDRRVMISGSSDKSIIFWDVLSGDQINRIASASEVWDLQILNNRTMGSAGQSCVDLWDLTSNMHIKSYANCHQGAVYAITHDKRKFHEHCFSTGGFDGAVKIWDMRIDSSQGAVLSYMDMHSSVNEVQFFGHQLVTGNGSGIVDMYDIRYLDHSKKIFSLNLSSSGAIRGLRFDGLKIVCGSSSGAIKLLDAQSGKFINHIMHNALQEFKSSQMTAIDCNENVLMSSSMGGHVSVFDFTNVSADTTTEDEMTDSLSRPGDRSCQLQ